MAKKIQLQIPAPCHENWDEMSAAEKGRFCNSCKKTVIDFSNMSDREIASFFKKPSTHSICGRFMGDQLNRDIEIPKKRIPWLKYFFQFALPAFLISVKASAQHKSKQATIGDTIIVKTPVHPHKQISSISAEMKLPAESNYAFKQNIEEPKQTPSFIEQSLVGFAGAVVVVRQTSKVKCDKKKAHPTSLLKKIFKDTSGNFKIYPNPVQSNSTLNIEWNQKVAANTIIQLFTQSGQMVFIKELNGNSKVGSASIQIPVLRPGNYFLKATNRATGQSHTEKLVIE